jgi:FkbM family methyltransferase
MSEISKVISINNQDLIFYGALSDNYMNHIDINLGSELNVLESIVKKYLTPNAISLDIGANIGTMSAALSRFTPEGKVFSFEPSLINYNFLNKNLSENKCHNCKTYQLAVGDGGRGMLKFHDTTHAAGSHVISDHHMINGKKLVNNKFKKIISLFFKILKNINKPKKLISHFFKILKRIFLSSKVENPTKKNSLRKYINVNQVSIDDWTRENNIENLDFVKIDVEGFEYEVITGMKKSIKKFDPIVFIEFNSWTTIAFRNMNPRFLLDFLISNFSYVYSVNKENAELVRISGEESKLSFLHNNLVLHGCVDDLMLSNSDLISNNDKFPSEPENI